MLQCVVVKRGAGLCRQLLFSAIGLLIQIECLRADIYPWRAPPFVLILGQASIRVSFRGIEERGSLEVTGSFPPGMSFGNFTGPFFANVTPELYNGGFSGLVGTPTTIGTYVFTLQGWDGPNRTGPSTPVLSVTVTVIGIAPTFSTQPQGQTITEGATATLRVVASGNPTPTLQWRKNGSPISGATTATLSVNSVELENSDRFDAVATNSAGSATSSVASFNVVAAPVITIQPKSVTATVGQSIQFSVTASGRPPPTYQWRKNSVSVRGATAATYSIGSVAMADAGSYDVVVSNLVGTTASEVRVLAVRPEDVGALSNLSIRASTGAGTETLILGFVLGGSGTAGSKQVLVRAAGPALVQFGVSEALLDPLLSLYDGGGRFLSTNDNWNASIADIVAGVGAFAFPINSRDAAFSADLSRGSYTTQVQAVNDTKGIVLAEVYDTSGAFTYSGPRLINLSARAWVGTDGEIMIAGFVVRGVTPVVVLIRAVGPTLTLFGVSSPLTNPRLAVYRDSTLLAGNDDWGDLGSATISSASTAVGAFSLQGGSKDSALLVTLSPGSYTVQVSGVGNSTGVALVEVYEVP